MHGLCERENEEQGPSLILGETDIVLVFFVVCLFFTVDNKTVWFHMEFSM